MNKLKKMSVNYTFNAFYVRNDEETASDLNHLSCSVRVRHGEREGRGGGVSYCESVGVKTGVTRGEFSFRAFHERTVTVSRRSIGGDAQVVIFSGGDAPATR